MTDIITEGQRQLIEMWPFAKELRNEFPYMADSLRGEFASKFNVYENGRVVSRELVQNRGRKNPTIGIISPGAYTFPTGGNTETLKVLNGYLEASVNDGPVSALRRDGTIEAPAETNLNLRVREGNSPCYYICRYEPKPEKAKR